MKDYSEVTQTFSKTLVDEFNKHHKENPKGLRYGQHFYSYFKLNKDVSSPVDVVRANEIFNEDLYFADDETAKSMIKQFTDFSQ